MKKVARMLRAHEPLILNWFRAKERDLQRLLSRASTTKSEWLPDDPTASAPITPWKLLCITTWGVCQNQNPPTDSAEEALSRVQVQWPGREEHSPHADPV